jgi:hypothetical protein
MNLKPPDQDIANDEDLLETTIGSLRDLAKQIENLKKQIQSGEDADLKTAGAQLTSLDAWMRNYVTTENRLAELRRKHRGPDDGGLALDLNRARFEIGCRLARIRSAKCKRCVSK